MSLKHGLLGLLNDDPQTGYELMKVFNNSLQFFWSVQTSQIYRDLASLENSGCLTSRKEEQSGKPDKKIYYITEKGKEKFQLWLNEYDFSKSLKTRSTMLMKIFFSNNGDKEKLIKSLKEYINVNNQFLSEYKEVADYIKNFKLNDDICHNSRKYWEITLLKGKIESESNIQWALQSLAILKKEE